MRTYLRILIHPRLPGAWNMAIDEVLAEGTRCAYAYTMRLYRWSKPTVSIGYAQAFAEAYRSDLGKRHGVDLVRRRTGGRAVLHDDELTYAIVGPSDEGPFSGGIHATYRAVASGLVSGLQRLGVEAELVRSRGRRAHRAGQGACFATRSLYELVADGRKLVGSAQRRDARRVLQHGSLLLGRPDPQRWCVLGEAGAAAAAMAVGLDELVPVRPGWRVLAATLGRSVAESLGQIPTFGTLTSAELRACRRAVRRYRDPTFLHRR